MFTCHISFVKRKYPGGTSTENTHSKLSPEVIHPQAMQRTMGSMQIPPLPQTVLLRTTLTRNNYDHNLRTYDMTPGFKPFTINIPVCVIKKL